MGRPLTYATTPQTFAQRTDVCRPPRPATQPKRPCAERRQIPPMSLAYEGAHFALESGAGEDASPSQKASR